MNEELLSKINEVRISFSNAEFELENLINDLHNAEEEDGGLPPADTIPSDIINQLGLALQSAEEGKQFLAYAVANQVDEAPLIDDEDEEEDSDEEE